MCTEASGLFQLFLISFGLRVDKTYQQARFAELSMSGHQTTLPEYDCASQRCTSLTFLSTSPENLECLGSISSVLSSAVVSILGFQNVSESISSDVVTEPKSKTFNQELHLNQNFVGQARQERSSAHVVFHAESSPVDFEWLLERCDNDDELVLDVLRSFCEQGQAHITALNSESVQIFLPMATSQ